MLIGVAIVLGVTLYPALRVNYQASQRSAALTAQLAAEQKHNDTVRKQVDALKTPQGVEQAAREDLGYTKTGEHAYVVLPADAATGGADALAATQAGVIGRSLLTDILDAIFGVPHPSTSVEP